MSVERSKLGVERSGIACRAAFAFVDFIAYAIVSAVLQVSASFKF